MPTPSQVLPPQVLAEVSEALDHLRYAYELRQAGDPAAQYCENHARAVLAVVIGQLPNPAFCEFLDEDVAQPRPSSAGC